MANGATGAMLHAARAFFCLLSLATAWPVAAAEAPAPTPEVRVTAADPASGGLLAVRDALLLRLSYRSAVPLRFQAEGYLGTAKIEEGAAYNPAPIYPAGEHEALVWISYSGAVRIDEVRVRVFDAEWQPVRSISYPVAAEWRIGLPRRHWAAWATRLSAAQQAMTSSAMADAAGSDDGIWGYSLALAAASIPAYLCLQLLLLFRYSGGWRLLAGLPLIGTIPLALYTLAALAMGSSLWPFMMLFLTPPAFLYLVGLLIVRLLVRSLAPS
jgi:hypothetical protein